MSTKKVKRYNSYTQVFADFKSGKLEGYKLMLDNDSNHLSYCGGSPHDFGTAAHDDYCDDKSAGVELTCGNGYSDIADILDAIGIPNERV